MKKLTTMIACLLLLAHGEAFAQEGGKHKKGHKADALMQRLHDMMPMYGVALSKLETALEKGDPAAVETEAGKMLATTPDLKKAKPHKNAKQLNKFKSIAAGFESELKQTVELARTGDFNKAKAAFKKAEDKCAECHALFR
ncbi:MAG: cytochrome c [Deltaproteobacteria bacterium]|nr:cytochrome c [Deltaproteobacteria bacterium]